MNVWARGLSRAFMGFAPAPVLVAGPVLLTASAHSGTPADRPGQRGTLSGVRLDSAHPPR